MITTKTTMQEVIQVASTCDVSDSCKTCMECCKKNSGYVLDEDIPKIAEYLKKTEQEVITQYLDEIELFGNVIHKLKLKKYPVGECIFLTKDGCGIHEVKPIHCKTGTWDSKTSKACHDWFVLNHLVSKAKPESIRQWNVHLTMNDHTPIKGGKIDELVPDTQEREDILKREK